MTFRPELVSDISLLHKFGTNTDIDTASVPEDVWDEGGVYPFPTAAATTTIVSDSAEDGAGGETGASTVVASGTDDSFNPLTETVSMNGTDAVTLSNDFYRVFRGRVAISGSNGTNVGNISIKHGSTVLAKIRPDHGTTLMAVYTTLSDRRSYLKELYFDIGRSGGGAAITVDCHFRLRPAGESWYNDHPLRLVTTVYPDWDYRLPDPGQFLDPGTDIVWRVTDASANNLIVQAGFDIVEVR